MTTMLMDAHIQMSQLRTLKSSERVSEKYRQKIDCLLTATTQANFKTLHLALGLSKQMIFSSLPCQPLPVLSPFTMDIMHIQVLNNSDLFIKLFTGKLNVHI